MAFTIPELLVSMGVLVLLMAFCLTAINHISTINSRARAKIDNFQKARIGFEAMTRRVSQAMLNTYWDYEYPTGADGKPDTSQPPQRYARQSELHMVSGPTKDGTNALLPNPDIQSHTHGIFSQSPQGFSMPVTNAPALTRVATLPNLLNVGGYFLEYGSDKDDLPNFLKLERRLPPERWRSRLVEMHQAAEYLRTYKATMPGSTIQPWDWFREPLVSDTEPSVRRVLADNVIALVIWPHRSPNDPPPSGKPRELAPDYYYDSRRYRSEPSNLQAKLTRNQLPPMIQVTMVAIDEASAARIEEKLSDPAQLPIAELGLQSLFSKPSTDAIPTAELEGDQYRADLQTLEQSLAERRLTYRVFSTEVSILQARWSED